MSHSNPYHVHNDDDVDLERVGSPSSSPPPMYLASLLSLSLFTADSIEIATRAANNFTRIYYDAYDSDTRLADLPKFYRPNSSLTWNGKPFQGTDGLQELVVKMPATKHEVQSFDCHPIPGTLPSVSGFEDISDLRTFRSATAISPNYGFWTSHPRPWTIRKSAHYTSSCR